MYLLDTNVVSELRKPKPHGAVVAWIESVPDDQLFISALTLGEFQAGVERTRKRDQEKAAIIESWIRPDRQKLMKLSPWMPKCFANGRA